MSEYLKHKMQTFEMLPPGTVWEAIVVRLDDDIKYSNLNQKIKDFQVAPPVPLWDSILDRLDDDEKYSALSKKINNYQVTPPAGLWNQIAHELDSDASHTIDFPDVKVRRISNGKKWYKMLAAAVIAAVLVGTSWYLLNQEKQSGVEIAKENNPASVPTVISTDRNEDSVRNKKQEIASRLPEAIAITTTSSAKNKRPALQEKTDILLAQNSKKPEKNDGLDYIIAYSKVNRPVSYLEQPVIVKGPVLRDENGMPYLDINLLSNNSNYLLIAGPNGQMTRISAKFANVIQFINNSDDQVEENLDRILRESGAWKERFQQWRDKIKKSGYLPAPGNFLDILEFKELIEEK
jgi:hypothetical protein